MLPSASKTQVGGGGGGGWGSGRKTCLVQIDGGSQMCSDTFRTANFPRGGTKSAQEGEAAGLMNATHLAKGNAGHCY